MKRKRRRIKLADGQWSPRSRSRKDGTFLHNIRCCNCALEHIIQYSITASGMRFRAWRLPKRR